MQKSQRKRRGATPEQESVYLGNKFCNDDLVDVKKPFWVGRDTELKKPDDAKTIFRMLPVPYREEEGGPKKWDTFLWEDDVVSFGEFIVSYWTFRGGNPQMTMIISEDDDYFDTPANLLYTRLYHGVQNGHVPAAWQVYLDASGNRAIIAKPSKSFFAMGLLHKRGPDEWNPPLGLGNSSKIVLMDLAYAAGQAVWHEIKNLHKAYPDLDPISIGSGLWCETVQNGYRCESSEEESVKRRVFKMPKNMANRYRNRDMSEREMNKIVCTFNEMPELETQVKEAEAELLEKCPTWDEVILIPTEEEQAALLSMRVPYEVLEYCWSDHPEWLPDPEEHKAKFRELSESSQVSSPPQPTFTPPSAVRKVSSPEPDTSVVDMNTVTDSYLAEASQGEEFSDAELDAAAELIDSGTGETVQDDDPITRAQRAIERVRAARRSK